MPAIRTTIVSAVTTLLFAVGAPLSAQGKLDVKVFTSSPGGFLVNSTLIAGAKQAVLVDAQFTRADAHRLVGFLIESGKTLRTVYITHDHPDHYFGLEVLRQAFPNASFVTLPGSMREINKTAQAKVKQWKPQYGNNIPTTPVRPRATQASSIVLDGETLQIVGPTQGDDAFNSFIWIPSLKTVIAGDIVYNGVHPWTAETNAESRKRWIATLDRIAALNPTTVVAGHQTADAGTSPSAVSATRDYLVAFDEALASSSNADELVSKMKSKYPNLALDIILTIGAQAAFKK